MLKRILAINQAIRGEAFVGLDIATRDALIETLSQVKENLTIEEERAGALVEGAPAPP